VDATPLFVVTAGLVEERNPGFLSGEYLDRQGEIRTLAEATARAIDWLMHRLETPSGLIESTRTQPGSHVNQVWKDSFDSYHHWDGALATPDTVASVEVVAHAFDALHHAARLAARYPEAGWPAPARVLEEKARDLRLRVLRLCWVGEEGYFAIGVDRGADGRLRPLRIRTSNMGRLLDSEILAGREWRPYRDAIVSHLSSEEMLASAGVRTLAADSVRYRPGSYHNGSVWPFDSALIARGLRRHGYDDLAAELYRRVTSACSAMRCYPEYVRGDGPRHEINRCVVDVVDPSGRINRLYQPPQLFQAWTVAAVISAPYSTSRPDHEEDRSQINGTQSRLPHSQRGIEQVPPGNNQTRHQRSR
jgi:glycogen debranching enzyme